MSIRLARPNSSPAEVALQRLRLLCGKTHHFVLTLKTGSGWDRATPLTSAPPLRSLSSSCRLRRGSIQIFLWQRGFRSQLRSIYPPVLLYTALHWDLVHSLIIKQIKNPFMIGRNCVGGRKPRKSERTAGSYRGPTLHGVVFNFLVCWRLKRPIFLQRRVAPCPPPCMMAPTCSANFSRTECSRETPDYEARPLWRARPRETRHHR